MGGSEWGDRCLGWVGHIGKKRKGSKRKTGTRSQGGHSEKKDENVAGSRTKGGGVRIIRWRRKRSNAPGTQTGKGNSWEGVKSLAGGRLIIRANSGTWAKLARAYC